MIRSLLRAIGDPTETVPSHRPPFCAGDDASDRGALAHGRSRVPGSQARDRSTDRLHKRSLHHAQLVAHSLHLWLREPGRVGGVLPGCRCRSRHTAQGRDEFSREGIRRLPDQHAAGSTDSLAVRRSRRDDARGVDLQSLRDRRGCGSDS